ncbi:MAG: hypothetical protein WCS94_05025 [Verrucomicrobiota bacterium]
MIIVHDDAARFLPATDLKHKFRFLRRDYGHVLAARPPTDTRPTLGVAGAGMVGGIIAMAKAASAAAALKIFGVNCTRKLFRLVNPMGGLLAKQDHHYLWRALSTQRSLMCVL